MNDVGHAMPAFVAERTPLIGKFRSYCASRGAGVSITATRCFTALCTFSKAYNLVRSHVALVEYRNLALGLAQVEEQLLLVDGGAHLHQRPRAQDVFMDRGLDPPCGIGGEPEALVRLEAFDRLHQTDVALRDQFGDRQAVAAMAP